MLTKIRRILPGTRSLSRQTILKPSQPHDESKGFSKDGEKDSLKYTTRAVPHGSLNTATLEEIDRELRSNKDTLLNQLNSYENNDPTLSLGYSIQDEQTLTGFEAFREKLFPASTLHESIETETLKQYNTSLAPWNQVMLLYLFSLCFLCFIIMCVFPQFNMAPTTIISWLFYDSTTWIRPFRGDTMYQSSQSNVEHWLSLSHVTDLEELQSYILQAFPHSIIPKLAHRHELGPVIRVTQRRMRLDVDNSTILSTTTVKRNRWASSDIPSSDKAFPSNHEWKNDFGTLPFVYSENEGYRQLGGFVLWITGDKPTEMKNELSGVVQHGFFDRQTVELTLELVVSNTYTPSVSYIRFISLISASGVVENVIRVDSLGKATKGYAEFKYILVNICLVISSITLILFKKTQKLVAFPGKARWITRVLVQDRIMIGVLAVGMLPHVIVLLLYNKWIPPALNAMSSSSLITQFLEKKITVKQYTIPLDVAKLFQDIVYVFDRARLLKHIQITLLIIQLPLLIFFLIRDSFFSSKCLKIFLHSFPKVFKIILFCIVCVFFLCFPIAFVHHARFGTLSKHHSSFLWSLVNTASSFFGYWTDLSLIHKNPHWFYCLYFSFFTMTCHYLIRVCTIAFVIQTYTESAQAVMIQMSYETGQPNKSFSLEKFGRRLLNTLYCSKKKKSSVEMVRYGNSIASPTVATISDSREKEESAHTTQTPQIYPQMQPKGFGVSGNFLNRKRNCDTVEVNVGYGADVHLMPHQETTQTPRPYDNATSNISKKRSAMNLVNHQPSPNSVMTNAVMINLKGLKNFGKQNKSDSDISQVPKLLLPLALVLMGCVTFLNPLRVNIFSTFIRTFLQNITWKESRVLSNQEFSLPDKNFFSISTPVEIQSWLTVFLPHLLVDSSTAALFQNVNVQQEKQKKGEVLSTFSFSAWIVGLHPNGVKLSIHQLNTLPGKASSSISLPDTLKAIGFFLEPKTGSFLCYVPLAKENLTGFTEKLTASGELVSKLTNRVELHMPMLHPRSKEIAYVHLTLEFTPMGKVVPFYTLTEIHGMFFYTGSNIVKEASTILYFLVCFLIVMEKFSRMCKFFKRNAAMKRVHSQQEKKASKSSFKLFFWTPLKLFSILRDCLRCTFMVCPWGLSFFDLGVFFLSVYLFGLILWGATHSQGHSTESHYVFDPETLHDQLNQAVRYTVYLKTSLGWLTLLSMVQCTRLFRFDKRFNYIWLPFTESLKATFQILGIIFPIFVGMAIVSFLLLGETVDEFQTIWVTLASCFWICLGHFSFSSIIKHDNVLNIPIVILLMFFHLLFVCFPIAASVAVFKEHQIVPNELPKEGCGFKKEDILRMLTKILPKCLKPQKYAMYNTSGEEERKSQCLLMNLHVMEEEEKDMASCKNKKASRQESFSENEGEPINTTLPRHIFERDLTERQYESLPLSMRSTATELALQFLDRFLSLNITLRVSKHEIRTAKHRMEFLSEWENHLVEEFQDMSRKVQERGQMQQRVLSNQHSLKEKVNTINRQIQDVEEMIEEEEAKIKTLRTQYTSLGGRRKKDL